jgi:hypothetical protein
VRTTGTSDPAGNLSVAINDPLKVGWGTVIGDEFARFSAT